MLLLRARLLSGSSGRASRRSWASFSRPSEPPIGCAAPIQSSCSAQDLRRTCAGRLGCLPSARAALVSARALDRARMPAHARLDRSDRALVAARGPRAAHCCAPCGTGPMQEHPHERQTGRRRSRCRMASSGVGPARRASDRGHDASGRRAPRALDALSGPVTCARLRGGGLRCDPPGRADRTGGARGELLVCLGPHERRRAAANAVRAPRGRARPVPPNCVYFDLCRSLGNGCGAPREGRGVGPERCATPDSSRGGT